MITWTGAVILPVVAILWILGYLVAVKKRVRLIAGYDPETTSDPDRYAAWVGGSACLCGLGLLVTWGLVALGILAPGRMLAGVIVSAAVSLVMASVAASRYTR